MHFSRSDATKSSIWLVFLLFSFVPFLFSGLNGTALASVAAGFAFFALAYALGSGYHASVPRRRLPLFVLVWCAVLLIGPLALLPLIGWYVLVFLPYFMAVFLYVTPGMTGYAMVGCGAGFTVILLIVFQPPNAFALAGLALCTPAFMALNKSLEDRKAAERSAESRLRLAREREAIASDIHDLLGQSLTVINLKSELARRQLQFAPEKAEEELRAISELTRSSLDEVRATVTALRQPQLAVELANAENALHAAGIAARVPEPSHAQEIAAKHQVLYAWAAREATTNILRHAGARRAWIEVTPTRLVVGDDGIGHTISPGNGLAGLRARVEDAGGTLSITSQPGRGTRIEVNMT